jgi:hypothetical protein
MKYMIRQELEQLSTGARDLRKFGLLVGGVFALIGGWLLFRHKAAWPYLLAPGALLVVLGLLAPRSLKLPYRAWMGMAFLLGSVVSTAILTVFYFLVVTPIGLLARVLGKDFLSLKMDSAAASYWVLRDRSVVRARAEYEQQF